MTIVPDNENGRRRALDILQGGGLVAVPTETVYGLAADATNADAVARIFVAKGRPSFNPLIAHVGDMATARRFGEFDDLADRLAEHFWPGPLTLVVALTRSAGIAEAVTAGLTTIALRQPRGTMARLCAEFGKPLAAPSANTSGRLSPTLAHHVMDDLGDKVDLVLDAGACGVGLESTIVKTTPDGATLLREGGIQAADIEKIAGPLARPKHDIAVEAPGMLLAHYAPRLPLRLNATEIGRHDAYLAFGDGDQCPPGAVACIDLSPGRSLEEAAHNLFASLRELDGSGAREIAVAPIPGHGIGAAINDRLRRAAHD